MLIVRGVTGHAATANAVLELSFERRRQARLRTHVMDGEEIGLFLDRGTVLRDGDRLLADDGRVVLVRAAVEKLLEVKGHAARDLARAAYHLGNRHSAVEIGADSLRCPADAVLAALLRTLGFIVREVDAVFEPEQGAYGGNAHAHSYAHHSGVIHDFVHRGASHDA